MYERLLTFLRCPACGGALELEALRQAAMDSGAEISEGLLHCGQEHWYPIVRSIPRMLPGALQEHREELEAVTGISLLERFGTRASPQADYDRRTRANFSFEWEHYELGDKTWGMDLDHRVKTFFLDSIGVPEAELDGKVLLDAGCGNGSQSVAYSRFGVEVIALDLSSGLEHGHQFRHRLPGAQPLRVHFVQGDLQSPPIAATSVDIIHSAGVLHHTPDTAATFHTLCPLLRPGGVFYTWLYKYEPITTPVVNTIRSVTTRLPAHIFAAAAKGLAGPFQLFCAGTNALGVRAYPKLTRREASLALMDIFGAPYAHYHSFPEVAGWYRDEGFSDVWACNESRRGFGVCGNR